MMRIELPGREKGYTSLPGKITEETYQIATATKLDKSTPYNSNIPSSYQPPVMEQGLYSGGKSPFDSDNPFKREPLFPRIDPNPRNPLNDSDDDDDNNPPPPPPAAPAAAVAIDPVEDLELKLR